jgi:hypothetical protein
MVETQAPTLGAIKRVNGVAGQYAYVVDVTYPGEATVRAEFVGSVYGAPIVAVWNGSQSFVTNPDRFGTFGPEWVRRFFGASS